MEREIVRQGGTLCRVENPRLSLDSFFLQEVERRETEHISQSKVEGGNR